MRNARLTVTAIALTILAYTALARADILMQPKPMGFGCPYSGTTRHLIELTHTDVASDGTHKPEAVSHWMEQFKIGDCVGFTDETGGPWKIVAYDDELALIVYAGRDADPDKPLHLWTRRAVLQVLPSQK